MVGQTPVGRQDRHGHALSHAVAVGNQYLVNYARQVGAMPVVVLSTVTDLDNHPIQRVVTENDRFTIGWIGSVSSSAYFKTIAPALAEVCSSCNAVVRLIGHGVAGRD